MQTDGKLYSYLKLNVMQNFLESVRRFFQSFIQRIRGGGQSPFSNIPLDNRTEKRKRAGIVIAIIVIIILGLGWATMRATPESSLYTFKTSVVEGTGAKMRVGTVAKAEYQITLLERRFKEAERLSTKSTVDESTLERLASQTEKNVTEMRTLIESDEEYDVVAVFNIMRDASVALKAMEIVVEDNAVMAPIEERVEDYREQSDSTRRDLAYLLVATLDDEHLREYINDQLDTLSSEVSRADLQESAIDDVARYIERMQTAIKNNNAVNAVEAVSDALQVIRIEAYFGNT